jgi:hypothetical protein
MLNAVFAGLFALVAAVINTLLGRSFVKSAMTAFFTALLLVVGLTMFGEINRSSALNPVMALAVLVVTLVFTMLVIRSPRESNLPSGSPRRQIAGRPKQKFRMVPTDHPSQTPNIPEPAKPKEPYRPV